MFQCGEFVIYATHGVCRVVGTEKQLVNRKWTEYLVLEPTVHQESRFYIPLQNPAAMSKVNPLMSRKELEALIASPEVRRNDWIQQENLRKQKYRDLISSGDRMAIMAMVHSLYRYRDEQITSGKKFHQCDENFLRDAERLLGSEVAMVMNCTAEEARTYLREQLK